MKIVFVHPHKAFLPDIDAYKEYFARYNISCVTATPDRFQHIERDIEWFFMGVDRSPRTPSICRIHEYVSASIPPFSRQKDRLKKWINQRPDFRIFQNQFVKDRLGFKDPVPFGFRLPCLAPIWYQPITPREKKFDFVYIGDLSTQRGIVPLLDHFGGPLKEHSLLLLSRDYDRLKKKYERATNITFEGPLQQEAVRNKLLECRFAINFIPDRLPFSHQVSTKLLEYAACRIPIITTDYAWIRDFERQEGGQYFFLSRDLNNFTWAAVNAFTYAYPEKKTYLSEEQIRRSGVISFLHERFPGTLLC